MNPAKVIRDQVKTLTDLPNIGKTVAHDLMQIGISRPDQLRGEDPFELYVRMCEAFGMRQDPCMLDVLISITDFMDGGEPSVWWSYTPERKARYGENTAITMPHTL